MNAFHYIKEEKKTPICTLKKKIETEFASLFF